MKIFKQLMIGTMLLVSVLTTEAMSEDKWCEISILHLSANGNRTDAYSTHSQTFVITPKEQCGLNRYLYVRFNNPAYSTMLTLALNAKNTSSLLNVLIDDKIDDETARHASEIQGLYIK